MVSVFSKNIHFLPENGIDYTQKYKNLRGGVFEAKKLVGSREITIFAHDNNTY